MATKLLKVAMIAPPWLALPTKGYGGIELVIEGLVDSLKKRGCGGRAICKWSSFDERCKNALTLQKRSLQ